MPRPLRTRSRLGLAVGALALVSAACTSSGRPQSFNDQLNADRVPQAEANFIEGCQQGGATDQIDNIVAVCQCGFERLDADPDFSFEEFERIDESLREDINAEIPPLVIEHLAACIRQEAAG